MRLSVWLLVTGVFALATEAWLPQPVLADSHCLSKSTHLLETSTGWDLLNESRQPAVVEEKEPAPQPLPERPEAVLPQTSLIRPVEYRPPPAARQFV